MHREWDNFVASAKNSTFLHMRPYMDYHSDRFNDYSLVAMKGGKIAGEKIARRAHGNHAPLWGFRLF